MLKFFVSTLVGFVVYWVLGFLFYGLLFSTFLPHPEETPGMMYMITAGCFFSGLFLAYVFTYIGGAATSAQAMRTGAILMGILGLIMHSFTYDCMPSWNMTHRVTDLLINVIMGAITAEAIWFASIKVGNKGQ